MRLLPTIAIAFFFSAGCVKTDELARDIEVKIDTAELRLQGEVIRLVVKTENKGRVDFCELVEKVGEKYYSDPYVSIVDRVGSELYSNFGQPEKFQESPSLPSEYGVIQYRSMTSRINEYLFWSDYLGPAEARLTRAKVHVGRVLFRCSDLYSRGLYEGFSVSNRVLAKKALDLWTTHGVAITSTALDLSTAR
jgi:hypothetical protein